MKSIKFYLQENFANNKIYNNFEQASKRKMVALN